MSKLRKALLWFVACLALLAAYLLLWPVSIEPVAWTPPEAPPLTGPYAPNTALAAAERLPTGGEGPEDVAIDASGRIYGGLVDGRIIRMARDGSGVETFADTGGRPLGLQFDRAGHLIVADAAKGLLSVAPDGGITTLATECDGLPFGFTDDVDIGPDGTIYFTDATSRWDFHHFREDILEHRPLGRLLAYDVATGRPRLLLGELYFANGVAVAPDGTSVLVNETSTYRVQRYWLGGPRAGQHEVVIDNLPGFPDGISRGSGGRFWVALYSPRVAELDAMLPTPWLRKVVYRLPGFLQPAPVHRGFVLGIDASGRVLHTLQDAAPDCYSPITSVEEHAGSLYLGSLSHEAIGRVPAPPVPAS